MVRNKANDVYDGYVIRFPSIRGSIKPGQRLVELRIIFSIMSLLGEFVFNDLDLFDL